jgi:hypothetical protein
MLYLVLNENISTQRCWDERTFRALCNIDPSRKKDISEANTAAQVYSVQNLLQNIPHSREARAGLTGGEEMRTAAGSGRRPAWHANFLIPVRWANQSELTFIIPVRWANQSEPNFLIRVQ